MTKPILFLDLSRLVRRYGEGGGPTGIDRIEYEYAKWADRQELFDVVAVARRGNGLDTLKDRARLALIETLTARWSAAGRDPLAGAARPVRIAAGALRARTLYKGRGLDAAGRASVYLNVGHDGLDISERYTALPGAFAVLLSDVIPLTHPEYDTPRATRLQRARVATLARQADHVACVTAAARDDLLAHAVEPSFSTSVAHLAPGLRPLPRAPSSTPTFVHVSSLDRRKNVPLLLHLWRQMVAEGVDVPRLVLIGRPGNDGTAAELIARCEAIRPFVDAPGAVSDAALAETLAKATALLSPSFVEGFGLPVLEARAAGVPVIASDIPAHREIGGTETVFCDPLDGPAWRREILRCATERPAPTPAAIPGWDAHFAEMTDALMPLARRRAG